MLRLAAPLGLAASVTLFAALAGGPVRATSLVPPAAMPAPGLEGAAGSSLSALEGEAARSASPDALGKLASAYLDRDQPGLAQAALDLALERDPEGARQDPEFCQLEARVSLRRGHAREALARARAARKTCEARGCPAWFEARAARQLGYLEELVSAGVEDPTTNPEAALAAYERSARKARLVAMR